MVKRWQGLAMVLTLSLMTHGGVLQAAEVTSAYTKIQYEMCREIAPPDEEGTAGASVLCPGYAGIPVYVAEGDLRMIVSFGANAAEEPVAWQTLPAFNTVNDTLEWRLRNGVPFATILRWFPQSGSDAPVGSVLIVTQLLPGATCQIARIDARANKKANEMAREAADRMAGWFDCSQAPVIIGNPGELN